MANLAILGGTSVGKTVAPSWPIVGKLEEEKVLEVVRSGVWGVEGKTQVEFEKAFSEYCNAPYGVMMTNGTHTLRLALEALQIGPGDEVIVPAVTWQATAATVLDVNAVPVLVDVDPETFTMDPKAVEAAITSRTRAIIPVHVFCRVCDMDALQAIAKKYDLYIIEDCAHQHGSEWKGQKVGTMGQIGSFSLQASKILTTGEGGICITKDKELYDRMYSLKYCGRTTYPGSPAMQSGNYRSNEFAAAVGLAQLSRLDEQNALRHENALYLEQELTKIPGITALRRDERITNQTYFHFYVRYNKEFWRNTPRKYLTRCMRAELEGSLQLRYTYEPLNASPLYRPFSKKTHKLSDEYCRAIDPARFDCPNATRIHKEEAFGFFHTHLLSEKSEVDKIIEAFHKVYNNLDEVDYVVKNDISDLK